MIRFLTDENFNGYVLAGLRRRLPDLDIIRIQDVGLRTARDQVVLEFAASQDRIVLSHDVHTMETHALARLVEGKRMSGIFLIDQNYPIGQAIEQIATIAECSDLSEWTNQIIRLPL